MPSESYVRARGRATPCTGNVSGTPDPEAPFRQAAVGLRIPAEERAQRRMRKERFMNLRQMMFWIPDGEQATITVSEPMSMEAIAVGDAISALLLRTLPRNVLERHAQDAGAIEYDSWLNHDAGAREYDSWFTRASSVREKRS
jgi:hypothetical protein